MLHRLPIVGREGSGCSLSMSRPHSTLWVASDLAVSVVESGLRINQVRLSDCFRCHFTSMISKYSNNYERKFILHAFIVLFTVYVLRKRTRKRKFEPSCFFI